MDGTTHGNGGIDVLIAEDNDVNQMVFSFIMEEIGLSFEMAANGEEVVSKFAELRPPMIIMDVSMPIMNGLEATAKIREIEKSWSGHVVIIAATAHALKGDAERCIEAGMDDYIAKPISPDKLKALMEQWLSKNSASATAG